MFSSAGPPKYWCLCNDGKTECKVKGHRLNVEGYAQLNYKVLWQNTLDELQHPCAASRKTTIHQVRKIVHRPKQYELHTQPHTDYHLLFNKQFIRSGTAITYPYGYRLNDADILDNEAHGLSSDLLDSDDDANVQALIGLDSGNDL